MAQFTISGESIEEIDELSEDLHRAEKLADSGLLEVFEKVVKVRDELEEQTESGSVRRNVIEEQLDTNVYQELQLLQAHGYAASGGQGGNWKYTGD